MDIFIQNQINEHFYALANNMIWRSGVNLSIMTLIYGKMSQYILSNNNVLSQAHTCSRIKSLGPLHYSSLSAGAHSRSTTEAVTVCLYVYTLQLFGRRNLIHCHGILTVILPDLHLQLLVEVAVINSSVPVDIDQVATHYVVNSMDVEVPHQQFHVAVKFIPPV